MKAQSVADREIDAAIRRRLRGTSVGRELAEQHAIAERLNEERKAARADYDGARAREPEIPALAKARDAAWAAWEKGKEELLSRLDDATRAFDHAVGSIDSVRNRAERTLRQGAPALIRDHGPVLEWLAENRLHVLRHVSLQPHQRKELLRDWKRKGVTPHDRDEFTKLEDAVALADKAESLVPVFERAAEKIRELQLEVEPDLPTELAKILGGLPVECPCRLHQFDYLHLLPNESAVATANA